MHNFQHKIPRGGSLELQIPGLKVLAKSKNPSISLGSWGTPRTRKAKNSVTFILSLDKWRCEGCGYEISDVFSVLRFYPFRILGKLSFWSQLSLRQLTSNTRLGNILLVLRSLLTLLFLSSILIFSGGFESALISAGLKAIDSAIRANFGWAVTSFDCSFVFVPFAKYHWSNQFRDLLCSWVNYCFFVKVGLELIG